MKLWGGLGVFSQSKRATNCATPGYEIFQLWSNMWSTPIFDQLPARGKVLSTQTPQGFAGFPRVETRTRASRSQITCATNCATPGYSVFLHDTMPRRKKQVFRVCGRRCGQARFCGSFSTGEFPPQATVPRTSGVPLLGEWIGHLSSQTTRATNCANPGYSVFCMIPCEGGKSKFSVSAGTPDLTDLSRRTGAAAATSLLYRFPAQSQVHSAGDRCSPADRATHIHGSSYITLCILQ